MFRMHFPSPTYMALSFVTTDLTLYAGVRQFPYIADPARKIIFMVLLSITHPSAPARPDMTLCMEEWC